MSLLIGISNFIGRRAKYLRSAWETVFTQLYATFRYRVAGDTDNDDLPESNGRAVINAIHGNTVKWNQLLASGRLVDMGLPSGTLWATSNIDITQEDGFAASPFQYGCTMFSWGNVEGHNTPASGATFYYNWGGANSSAPWYEGQPYGATPGSTLTSSIVANDTQDAARRNAGALFKIPSKVDFQELIDICIFIDANGNEIPSETTDKRVTVNGICGIYLQSTINGNKLFFACSGKGIGKTWNGVTSQGNYWTSTYSSARYGVHLSIHSGAVNTNGTSGRFSGMAIRPIVVPSTTSEVGHDNHKFCLTSNHKNMVDLTALEYPNIASTTPTVAEVEAWLALNVGKQEYYPYDEGSLISFKGTGIKSVGFNQWDGTYYEGKYWSDSYQLVTQSANSTFKTPISLVKDVVYYLNTSYNATIKIFNENNSLLMKKNIATSSTDREFSISQDNCKLLVNFSTRQIDSENICINVSDAAKNGTYEPYWSDEKPFDVTKVYGKLRGEGSLVQVFPNGMFEGLSDRLPEDYIEYSYGDIEAAADNKKIDLGDCAWSLVSGCSHTFETTIDIKKAEAIGYTFSDEIDESDTTQDKLIGLVDGGSTKLALLNRSLSSTDLVSGHITALEGVDAVYYHPKIDYYRNLVYRDNGTDTPLEEIFPIKYKVDKYSTEELLVPASVAGEPTSTAIIADIDYQKKG